MPLGENVGGFNFVPTALEANVRCNADALPLYSEFGDVSEITATSNSRPLKVAFVRRALAELAGSCIAATRTRSRGPCLACCGRHGPL